METLIGKPTPKEAQSNTSMAKQAEEQEKYPHLSQEFLDVMRFFKDGKPFSEYTTEQIDAQLAKLEKFMSTRKNGNEVDAEELAGVHSGWYRLKCESIHRKNPEAKRLYDQWKEIEKRIADEKGKWAKPILEKEGIDEVTKRSLRGEEPENYTKEDLDVFVKLTRSEIDGGLYGEGAMKYAEAVRDAGGFQKEERIRRTNFLLSEKEKHESGNDPDKDLRLKNIKEDMELHGISETKQAEIS